MTGSHNGNQSIDDQKGQDESTQEVTAEQIRVEIRKYNDASVEGQNFSKKRDYKHAIEKYNEAIELSSTLEGMKHAALLHLVSMVCIDKDKLAAIYYNRGFAYKGAGQLKEAIQDHLKAINLDSSNDKQFETLLADKSKKEIFNALKNIKDDSLRNALIKQCMDPSTKLGKRMYKQEGVSECTLEHGTLAKIKSYAEDGCPYSSEKTGLFNRLRAKGDKQASEVKIHLQRSSKS